MNNLLMGIGLPPTPVKTEAPSKDYNKIDNNKEDFDSVIKKVSKKLDKVESSIKKKEVSSIKKNKIDLEETHSDTDISTQEEAIINLLAQYLQMPIEEIQQALEKLEIDPMDLTNKENFGEFISELYGQPLEELLLSNTNIKSISSLWEKIEQIAEPLNEEMTSAIMEPHENRQKVYNQISDKETDNDLKNLQMIDKSSLEETSKIVSIPTIAGEQESKKNVKALGDIDQTTIGEGDPSIRLGLQVPIEAFNASSGSKMWDQASKEQLGNRLGVTTPIETQMLDKIEIVPLSQGREIHMDLAPKELGKISFKLVEENGMLTAQIRVENEKTKELVLQSLTTLKEGLKEQGLMIGDFTVDVRDQSRQSQMNQERQKSSKRIEEIIAKHLDGAQEDELEEEVKTTSSELDIMA